MVRKSPAGAPLARISGSNEHPLMTIHAAAQALGCSDMTIRRRVEARQFPAVKIGCKALVPRAFVEQLIADALAGRTVVVEEYAATWSEKRGDTISTGSGSESLNSSNIRERVAR
jgi:excisionase family DNA binding protein